MDLSPRAEPSPPKPPLNGLTLIFGAPSKGNLHDWLVSSRILR